jgi:O-antigen/teichoic acid export membrane protein
VIGLVLIAWSPTEASAMLGVTIATFAPVVVGWWALRHPRPSAGAVQRHHPREVVREVVHNSQALLAFFALSNVDVIVARNVLPAHDAGLYAGGLIMTKAVLFLPQFVVVLAFPAMSTVAERRYALTRSLAVVAFLGLCCTVVALGFPQLALIFVGGAEYQDIADLLWLFALLGTVLSMLQLVIYAVLARQGRRSTLAVWVALVALVGIGATTSTVVGLLVAVMTVDTLLFLLLTGVTLRLIRNPEEQELASTSPS